MFIWLEMADPGEHNTFSPTFPFLNPLDPFLCISIVYQESYGILTLLTLGH